MITIERLMTGTPRKLVDGEMSAIWKRAVSGTVRLGELGLDGDDQAYRGHSGPERALLHYAEEHYGFLVTRFLDAEQDPGVAPTSGADGKQATPTTSLFGGNILTFGNTEESVCLDDRYRFGLGGSGKMHG